MTYISDQYGQVLRRNKTQANGNLEVAHRFYYMNGHTIGDVSSEGPSTISYAEELAQRGLTTPGGFRNAKPVSSADFDQNYQPINSSYPGATASAYTVRKGDTLGAIARAVWGDESLWYLLADANGLTISDTLIEGQVLTVPNKVSNFHNNASTFKVYNAGQAIGDTMPVLPPEPMPPPPPQQSKGGGCGVMGKLIMVVVAVVVTYMSMGAATGVAASIFGAGTTATTVAAGAIAGAVGSVASQTVGMAIGAQDGFNWNGVALGALGGAVSAGVMNTGMGPTFSPGTSAFVKGAVQGGISNTITQGVAVATGLQHSFDWRGVAAGAIASGVGAGIADQIGQSQYGEQGWADLNNPLLTTNTARDATMWSELGQTMARGVASGMAAGMASSLVRGGSLRNSFPGIMQDVIASTVGNAIGLGAQVTQKMTEQLRSESKSTTLAQEHAMKLGYGPLTDEAANQTLSVGPFNLTDFDDLEPLAFRLNGSPPLPSVGTNPLACEVIGQVVDTDIPAVYVSAKRLSPEQRVQQIEEIRGHVDILRSYAEASDRERYWNYLAAQGIGYAQLALGVVRNDTMNGFVANSFAQHRATELGVVLDERDWNKFGVSLMREDFAYRMNYSQDDRTVHLAMELPVQDIAQYHADRFKAIGLDAKAWTEYTPLSPYLSRGDFDSTEQVWAMMMEPNQVLQVGGTVYNEVKSMVTSDTGPQALWLAKVGVLTADYLRNPVRGVSNTDRIGDWSYDGTNWETTIYDVTSGTPPSIIRAPDSAAIELSNARSFRLERLVPTERNPFDISSRIRSR